MAIWPQKRSIITELLETVTNEFKKTTAKALKSSDDPDTAKIGRYVLNALEATSMNAAIPHFYALRELFPKWNYTHFQVIFGRPFVQFREDLGVFNNDPDFTRRLNFNDMREVFINGDLMIGVYYARNFRCPPHLLAYNMKTERMEWGIPLTPAFTEDLPLSPSSEISRLKPAKYHLSRVGEDMALQFIGQQNVHIINSISGEVKASIELPYKKESGYDALHLTPDGFGYQLIHDEGNPKLVGGKVSDSELIPLFEVKTPGSCFLPLSTHVGVTQGLKNKLELFSPTGKSVTLDCFSAQAHGDKLYLTEPNPADTNTCKLTVRTMTNDDNVVSDPERTIILKTKRASLKSVCDNGQIVLFSDRLRGDRSPIFVSPDSEEIVYGEHEVPAYANQVINTATGDVWSWDRLTKKIWKISPEGAVLMGSLGGGDRTTLLHVDESDHLYLMT